MVLGPVAAAASGLPLGSRDRYWLALATLPGFVAVTAYLVTNPYPAYGAGLYAQIAGEILGNGYVPPTEIPGYTTDGVPFAYPPLQFYLFAVLLDIGVTPVTVARFLPPSRWWPCRSRCTSSGATSSTPGRPARSRPRR
ncbi:hypothetical protein VB779_03390 [Haloarculaceae archaeon H-GB11]|nr:hypothetical protein [Haloarculaceae archaeon H-GB11]